jgi:octaheme c-type cytochrome (tetrathionate reductase family)
MFKPVVTVILTVVALLILLNFIQEDEYHNLKLEKLKQEYAIKPVSSVDHSKLEALNKTFNSPQEVTEACISCHTERHKEIMNSSHWNWERISYVEGRGISATGKKNVLNNFCIGSKTNEQSCAKCHIGYGMTDNDAYDYNNARNVDCMVCHDNSEDYHKGSALAGYPDRSVNFTEVAKSVGSPKKMNCGSCHFYGGGGNNVKHGDLEEALMATTRDIDVHMAANGMDMSCTDCHTAENHQILGKLYTVSSTNTQRATCEQCHTSTPHFDNILNRHNAKVSCQTCHIPTYAKVNSTKMEWKWSTAGKLKEGEPYELDDSLGNHTYLSMKGDFKWERNVKPDYIWFNGTADHYVLGDQITSNPVQMNTLFGSHDEDESKIIPVKIHKGDQIYDKVHNLLIQPKLYSEKKGDSAFWQDFNWDNAARAGMERIGLPYSGEYAFIETEMYLPVNHMVAPKSEALGCAECHTREKGRLANLEGFYLPGRDYNKPLETGAHFLIIASLIGVLLHSLIRVLVALRRKKYNTEIIDYNNH